MKLLIICSLVYFTFASDCEQIQGDGNQCRCKTKEGFIVDLSKLSVKKDLKPTNNDTATYSLSLCTPFDDAQCKTFSICQESNGNPFNAGNPPSPNDNSFFQGDPWKDTLQLHYQATDAITRHSYVRLTCSHGEDRAVAEGEHTEDKNNPTYFFTYETKEVCKPNPAKEKKGLSTGSILCIVFLVLLVVYFVGGFLYLRYMRGARGVEQVPNFEFWKELPLLIWDGAVFLKGGCKADTTYDQI